jgi:hypothetical protein
MYATILTALMVIGQVAVEPDRWARSDKEVVVAATIWNNALSDGDFNAAGNWTNGVPSSINTPAIFNATTQSPPTTNLDRTASSFRLIVTDKFRSDIGSSGSPLIWEGTAAAETTANLRGPGTMYLDIRGASKDVVVESTNRVNAVTLKTTTGDIRHLVVLRGHCTALGTCSFTGRAFVTGNQAKLTINAVDTTELPPDVITVLGGLLVNHRTMDNSGDLIQLSAGTIEQSGALETAVRLHVTGGVFKYTPNVDVSAKAPVATIMGGVFDARESDSAIGFGSLIHGPNATVLGDVTAHVVPTLELWQQYP